MSRWVIAMVVILTGLMACTQHDQERPRMEDSRSGQDISESRSTSFFNRFRGGFFHIYTDRIDWEEPVGLLYYFSGDYFSKSESEIFQPRDDTMTGLADQAARRNMVFVVPSPPSDWGYNGHTWWEEGDKNLEWFLELNSYLNDVFETDASRRWFMGYSGGAEFITYELLPGSPMATGSGGAILVGGGGSPEKALTPDGRSDMWLLWNVGDRDVQGATNPAEWSALRAAKLGEKFYADHGFNRTQLTIIRGADHLAYDLPSILDENLRRAGVEEVASPFERFVWHGLTYLGVAVLLAGGTMFIWRHRRIHTSSRRPPG